MREAVKTHSWLQFVALSNMRILSLTYKDPQQRPHDDHHHKHDRCDDESDVWDAQQTGPKSLESFGLPSGLSVHPADLLQSVVNCSHLHRHICNLQTERGGRWTHSYSNATVVAVDFTRPLNLSLQSVWILTGMWLMMLKWYEKHKRVSPDTADLSPSVLRALRIQCWDKRPTGRLNYRRNIKRA